MISYIADGVLWFLCVCVVFSLVQTQKARHRASWISLQRTQTFFISFLHSTLLFSFFAHVLLLSLSLCMSLRKEYPLAELFCFACARENISAAHLFLLGWCWRLNKVSTHWYLLHKNNMRSLARICSCYRIQRAAYGGSVLRHRRRSPDVKAVRLAGHLNYVSSSNLV